MPPAGPQGRRERPRREDVKAAFERFQAAVRENCPHNLHARFLQAVDLMEQAFLGGHLLPESAKSSLAQVRGGARRSMRETPTDMVRILKALDGMEDEMNRFFAALGGSP